MSRTFGSLSESNEENFDDTLKIKDQTQLNFLLIGTSDGNLHLSVFGLFSCGMMNINKYMTTNENDKYTSVLKAEMSRDMKVLFLLVAVDEEKFHAETMEEENGSNKVENAVNATGDNIDKKDNIEMAIENSVETLSSGSKLCTANVNDKHSVKIDKPPQIREIRVVILDTRILSSRSRELHALSLKQGQTICLLDYLERTMSSIVEAWENIYLLEIESKLSKHAESQPEGSLSADFLELLLFGVPSESLENFLLKDLNDKGIKKLGHSIELSHSNIQKLILKHLLSVGQCLAYHLAEMKGMSKLTDRFKVLGLEETAVSKAFSAAGAFLIKSTEVQLVIDESMKRYKAFFRWLYAIIIRITDDRIPDLTMTDINQQDLEFIADYLYKLDIVTDKDGVTKRHCNLDRLGQYLVNEELTKPPDCDRNNLWQKLLEDNPCLQNHFSIIEKNKYMSLVQQHEHLKKAIQNVFKTPEHAIGNMFQLKQIVTIANLACSRISMSLVEDHTLHVSLIEGHTPDYFQVYKVFVDGTRLDVKSKSVPIKSEKAVLMKCIDVKFYLPEVLSILLEEGDENKNAVIVQVTTNTIFGIRSDSNDRNKLENFIETREIPDMVASSFAVSGLRKVSIVLSESRRKVRLFEMEAEDDEEEEDTSQMETQSSFVESQKTYYKTGRLIEDKDGCFVIIPNISQAS